MIQIREIALSPGQGMEELTRQTARLLHIPVEKVLAIHLVRRSIDARKKPQVQVVYTIAAEVAGEEAQILRRSRCKKASIFNPVRYEPPRLQPGEFARPVVVGFGPAGMFAALILAMAGLRPIVLERGEDAASRHKKVLHFFQTGELDAKSNVQFGEGGAGTFSDGKLNTGVNNPRIQWILEQFVAAGAREDILYDAKPHVGTDVLLTVVQNLRSRIVELGGQVRFCTQVTGLQIEAGCLTGLELEDGGVLPCNQAILAIGHSARDTFSMLERLGVPMEPKPFSMGVRIEHLQRQINLAQYGSEDNRLPPADYKLVQHLSSRTVYTFCMCPGGYVVAAASEPGRVVTNGMSNADRDGENANAALLVTVNPADFPYEGVLGGVRWQQEIEARAYQISDSYRAPAQLVGDFLAHRPSTGPGTVLPTYSLGVCWCDLHTVLPEKLTAALEEAIPDLGRRLQGFDWPDGVLTAPETRSSSPVRILRGQNRQSAIRGLYPAGEGAGYAGGIMSAAIDGMQSAEAVIEALGGAVWKKSKP